MARTPQAQAIRSDAVDPQLLAMRVPPHSIEAEQSLLGGLLLDNQAFDKIADQVTADDFYRDDHRRIFRHLVKLIQAAKPADVVTVAESIDASEDRERTGGAAYLGALSRNTPSALNIRRYAELVRERSVQRRLAQVATEIAENALGPSGKDVRQLLDEAESRIMEVGEAGTRSSQGFKDIKQELARVFERLDELYHSENRSGITGIPTGFIDLDEKTAGLQPGDLIIIAGRPSMGKTALALNIAEHVAVDNGLPVAIFSMEMSGTQLASRVLGSIAHVDQHKMRTGRLSDEEWQQLSHAMGRLHEAPVFIDETAALNALELRARARRLKRQCGKLLFEAYRNSRAQFPGCIFAMAVTEDDRLEMFTLKPYERDWNISHEDLSPMHFQAAHRGRLEEDELKQPIVILKPPQSILEYFDFKGVPETDRGPERFTRMVRDECIRIARKLIATGLDPQIPLHLASARQFFAAPPEFHGIEPFPLDLLARQRLSAEDGT